MDRWIRCIYVCMYVGELGKFSATVAGLICFLPSFLPSFIPLLFSFFLRNLYIGGFIYLYYIGELLLFVCCLLMIKWCTSTFAQSGSVYAWVLEYSNEPIG